MKKTLVYHLYVGDDIETNVVYKIHKECLKVFQHLFDNVRIVIALDDLKNKHLKTLGVQWVNDIFESQEIEITYTENTKYREAKTFYDKVLNNFNDSKVFFMHSKGTTNFKNPDIKNGSIFCWICAMYFFNLSEKTDTIDRFVNGCNTICGALLLKSEENSYIAYKSFYMGTAYWVNLKGLHNLEKTHLIPICECSDRYFAERYPGRVLGDDTEYGITCTNNVLLSEANPYDGNLEDWIFSSELYGCKEEFIEFIRYISNKVGYIPYSE